MPDRFAGTPVEPLARCLAAIRARYPTAAPEWVAEVVHVVLDALGDAPSPQQMLLLHEVEQLGRTIAAAKAEIAALRVDDITARHIPFATDELDAIVAHTDAATHAILASCETLDTVAEGLDGSASARLLAATTRIYEACSFQDITGQRISKVVHALQSIDAKVSQILTVFGGAAVTSCIPDLRGSDELLSGPQRPATAMAQSEIDRLLASLD